MKIKLTSGQKGTVNKLPFPESGQALYWDNQLTGFGLRVTPKTKTYFVQARTSTGKSRRVSLGRHPTMTADKARKKALDTLSDFNAGLDPVVEKEKEKVLGVTLRDVVEDYLADRDLKKASIESIKYHLEKTFDDWADKPAVLITRDMVRKRFDEKTEESGPAQANQAFRNLRAWLNYAGEAYRPGDKRVFGENPVAVLKGIKNRAGWNKVGARNQRIPLDKVGAVWNVLTDIRKDPEAPYSGRTADYVAFLLLTGARGTEAAELKWDHLDLDNETFSFVDPKTDPVTLPMSRQVKALLESRPRSSEYVFPGYGRTGRIKDARNVLRQIEKKTGVRVSRHDLRRTFTTIGQHLKIELWRVELLTNHVPTGITLKHYSETADRSFLKEETDMIGDWIEKQGNLAAAKVVDLATRRAGK